VKIWCNADLGEDGMRLLAAGVGAHDLVLSGTSNRSVLAEARRDPALAEADIAFGQPDPADCLSGRILRWVEVSSAGYTRYDSDAFRDGMLSRGVVFTNASQVYADSCAQHVLAMMLALNRQLLASFRGQLGSRTWPYDERRAESRLLTGQSVVMLGFGSIGTRLSALLAPFAGRIYAVRRRIHSEPGAHIVPEADLTRVLAEADHVVDLLPENDGTRGYVNARRIECFRPGARFYNVGRGATVDQEALIRGLESGRIGAAYLDVTVPEPLPPGHPLWSAPNCFITPHTAGGRSDVNLELARHFLANLAAFEKGRPMTDRIL